MAHMQAHRILTVVCFSLALSGELLAQDACPPLLDANGQARSLVSFRAPYRFGYNNIDMHLNSLAPATFNCPSVFVSEIRNAGGQGFRQLKGNQPGTSLGYGVPWWASYSGGSLNSPTSYDFSRNLDWIRSGSTHYFIPTLFQIGPDAAERACAPGTVCEGEREPCLPDCSDRLDPVVHSAAIGAYVTAAAQQLDGILYHWEVMNELEAYPKFSRSWGSWDATQYVDLLSLTRAHLRAVNPNNQVVLGGLVSDTTIYPGSPRHDAEKWLGAILDAGGGSSIDVYNFHFYREWDQTENYIVRIRAVLEDYDALHHTAEASKPLWMTEYGSDSIATWSGARDIVEEDMQAQRLVKIAAIAYCNGVELVNWNTLISSSDGARPDGTIPSWCAYGVRERDTPYSGAPAAQVWAARRKYAWYTAQLMTGSISNFDSCQRLSQGGAENPLGDASRYAQNHVWAYHFIGALDSSLPPTDHYILWSNSPAGEYVNINAASGGTIAIGDTVQVVRMTPPCDYTPGSTTCSPAAYFSPHPEVITVTDPFIRVTPVPVLVSR